MCYIIEKFTGKVLECLNRHGAFFASTKDEFESQKEPSLELHHYCVDLNSVMVLRTSAKALFADWSQVADRWDEDLMKFRHAMIFSALQDNSSFLTGEVRAVEKELSLLGVDREEICAAGAGYQAWKLHMDGVRQASAT